jgi:hypothetical protein
MFIISTMHTHMAVHPPHQIIDHTESSVLPATRTTTGRLAALALALTAVVLATETLIVPRCLAGGPGHHETKPRWRHSVSSPAATLTRGRKRPAASQFPSRPSNAARCSLEPKRPEQTLPIPLPPSLPPSHRSSQPQTHTRTPNLIGAPSQRPDHDIHSSRSSRTPP